MKYLEYILRPISNFWYNCTDFARGAIAVMYAEIAINVSLLTGREMSTIISLLAFLLFAVLVTVGVDDRPVYTHPTRGNRKP